MSPRRGRPLRFVLVSADEQAIVDALHAEPEWPRQDVVELARALDAELLSYSDLKQASWFTRALARWVGQPIALAWLAFRRRGTFYFGNAENTALPLALLLKMRPSATVAFIGHRLTTPLKTRLIRVFNLLRHVDVVFVYSALQARHLIDRFGFPADRVRQIPFQVDDRFFTPSAGPTAGRGVVSVGREMRDYPTLFAALGDTGVPVTVVASSPWSNRADETANLTIPENVTIRRNLSNLALREAVPQRGGGRAPALERRFSCWNHRASRGAGLRSAGRRLGVGRDRRRRRAQLSRDRSVRRSERAA